MAKKRERDGADAVVVIRNRWTGETEEEQKTRKREYNRQYRKNHAEQCAALCKRWQSNNAERVREMRRVRYRENAEKNREQKKAYYRRHKEARLAAVKEYRKKNPAQALERQRRYCVKNRERIRSAESARNEKDPSRRIRRREYRHEHYQKNKQRYIAQARNREASIAGVAGTHTAADIKVIWDRQKHKCAVRGCAHPIASSGKDKYHVDHVIALKNNGDNWPSNLQILCRTHNSSKQAQDEYEWAQEHGMLFPK